MKKVPTCGYHARLGAYSLGFCLLLSSAGMAELPPDAIPPIGGISNHSGKKPTRIDITPSPRPAPTLPPQPPRPRIDIPPPPRPPVRKPPVMPKGLKYDENDQQIEMFYYYVE